MLSAKHFRIVSGCLLALLLLLVPWLGQCAVETNNASPLLRAEKVLKAAHERFKANPQNAEAAWQYARACFDRADLTTNNTERAAIASEGISAARQSVSRMPQSAAAHYYLGMNLAELAETKSVGALKLVGQMETEFKTALELDEKFDFGGSDRNLGLLYRDAPGWPVSVGNHNKARQHLLHACQLSPDYPENLLNLLETYLKWGESEAALREAKKFQESLPTAQKQFAGDEWQASWIDWTKRWEIAQRKLGEKVRSQSPHSKH